MFTSATLTVANNFDHFKQRLGIETDNTAVWDSPFDYSKQAVMYVPESLPEPTAPEYTEAVVEKAIRGMLPKSRLGSELFRNLFVVVGETHQHEAQQPKKLDLNKIK